MSIRALLIHNSGAGSREVHSHLSAAMGILQRHGWKIERGETATLGDAREMARRAVTNGIHTVIVAGGDGTVSNAADGLISAAQEQGCPPPTLGILPCGTGNVLARQLGLPVYSLLRPFSLEEAAEAMVFGHRRLTDVGRVNGKHFLCWVGIGIDAQIATYVEEQPEIKKRLGPGAFALAAVPTLRGPLGTHAHVVADGRRISRRLILAVISNIRLYAAFFQIAPEALMDDGLLDVACFHGETVQTALHLVWQVVIGRHTHDGSVTYHKANHVEVRTRTPLPVHADSEPIGTTPAIIECVPRALHLIMPDGATPHTFSAANGRLPLV